MINHKHKFIFIHIPKTGGTSIEKLFVSHETDVRKGGKNVEHKHHSAQQMRDAFPEEWPRYFKFSVIRNPWDWLVSRYFWSRGVGPSGDSTLSSSKTFKGFLHKVKNGTIKSTYLREALKPQYTKLANKNNELIIDFVCKFENLQTDFNTVSKKLGIKKQALPHVHKTKHKHYTEYYDDETRELVADIYAKDIEYFGYKFGE